MGRVMEERQQSSGAPVVIVVIALLLVGACVVGVSAFAFLRATEGLQGDEYGGSSVGIGGWSDEEYETVDHTGLTLDAPEHVIEEKFRGQPWSRLHVFAIPEDTVLVRASVLSETHDVDVFMVFDEDAAASEDWDISADGVSGDEFVWAFRQDSTAMGGGRCYVRVTGFPDDDFDDEEEIEYRLTLRVVRFEVHESLTTGRVSTGTLTPLSGHRRAYHAPWPDGAGKVRIDLVDATQNLDMFVAFEDEVLDLADYDKKAVTEDCTESLVLDRDDVDGDTLLITVIDQDCHDVDVPYRLLVSAGDAPPAILREPRSFPQPRTPVERTARAVVRLDTDDAFGSGVLLTPKGLVLTAHHVVGDVGSDIVVSTMTDVGRPPLESYRGTVVRADANLDVALLQIDRMLDGSPVPKSVQFPTIPVRWTEGPALGERTFLCGYHDFDDDSTRDPISWTTGAVSGWEEHGGFRLVRVAALTTSGVSGGAVLDTEHRLVGTVVLMNQAGDADTSAEAAIVPAGLLPTAWTEFSGAGR